MNAFVFQILKEMKAGLNLTDFKEPLKQFSVIVDINTNYAEL